LPGRGVRSQIDGKAVRIGSLKLFEETSPKEDLYAELRSKVARLERDGRTTMFVGVENEIVRTGRGGYPPQRVSQSCKTSASWACATW
jgi:cation transport ATPase